MAKVLLMLPVLRSQSVVEAAQLLQTALGESGKPPRLRVFLSDGTTVQGELSTASADRVALVGEDGAPYRELPLSAISAIHVAVPDRNKDGLLMIAAIVAGTAGVVAIAVYGGESYRNNATKAFSVVYLAGVVAMQVLLRTRFRRWLTRWEPWFSSGEA